MTTPDWSPQRRREVRRVMLSSYLGTTIEFYDFLLYGTAAAVVFNQLFFTDLDPLAGTLASFGTLAVGYVARPLGGVVFGHFGDRVGRKSMLVTTMTIMVWPAPDRRVGRRPVMIGGALLLAALAWPVTALVAIGSVWSLLLAFLLGNTLSQAAMYGPMAAFISEMFGTSARYTGASLGYQLATMIGGGFGP